MTRENVLNSFVYNRTGRTCDTVIINGKIAVQGSKVKTVNEDEVVDKVQKYGEKVLPTAP